MIPYIGITGFTAPEDVRDVFQGFYPLFGRKFMVGVLMGDKTLRGIPTKWDARRPSPLKIANIFSEDVDALNLIHFRSRSEGNELTKELIEVTKIGGANLHGLQINMTWPKPAVIEKYRMHVHESRIVLQ